MLDFGLVREALRERRLLLTELAPHLVRPVPFLWPLTHRGWERPYVGAGLLLYDSMGGRRAVPRARHLSRRKALRLAPALKRKALVGAVRFYDAQEDDARMVACLARTAAAHGAALATRVEMTEPVTHDGRVTGAGRPAGRHRSTRPERQAVEGRPHRRAAQQDPHGHRPAHQDREERAVRDPMGAALADRRHRHRVAV